MKSLFKFSKVLIFLTVFTSCIKEEYNCSNKDGETALKINPALPPISSLARSSDILKHTFMVGDKIGLIIMNEDLQQPYQGKNENLSMYTTYDGTNWNSSAFIALSEENARVFAYYPYESGVNSHRLIPVKTDPQTDYLYGIGPAGINRYSPWVNLTMKHALACFRFKLKRGSYQDSGLLTSVAVSSPVLGTTGFLNVENGAFSSVTGNNERIQAGLSRTIQSDGTVDIELLIIPPTGSADIHLFVTLDGTEYHCILPAVPEGISAGKIYDYTVTANAGTLTLSEVTIQSWELFDVSDDNRIEASFTVTITGDTEGIALAYSIVNDVITMQAVAVNTRNQINTVNFTPASAGVFTQSANGIVKTITLSKITEDVSVVFNGLI